MSLYEVLEDSLAVEATPQDALSLALVAQDGLTLAGVGNPGCVYGLALEAPLELFGRVLLNGEEWDCWMLSTSQFFPSVYSNFDFNSFAHHSENDYAANDNGVYVIDGDTDDGQPFNTGIMFHPSSFGNTMRKKFRKLFVSAIGDNLVLQGVTDNGSRLFKIVRNEASVTRDLRGRRWQFIVAGFDVFDYYEAFPTSLVR